MDFNFVKSAIFVPNTHICDPQKNAQNHIFAINEAIEKGIELLAFPELSLTGVNLGDLYFNDALLSNTLTALGQISSATANSKILVFVGAPIKVDNKIFNTAVAINEGKILAVIPKLNLTANASLESKYFSNQITTSKVTLFGEEIPFGNDIIFSEKENSNFTVSANFFADTNKTPANITITLASEPEWVGKKEYIETMLSAYSKSNGSAILFANAGKGETGTDMVYSGRSYIYENGKSLAKNPAFNTGFIVSDIDSEYLSFVKGKYRLNAQEKTYRNIEFSAKSSAKLERKYNITPFIPQNESEKTARAELILDLQAQGLANRFTRSYSKSLVLGLSGGLDSTLALLVCYKAVKKLGLPLKTVKAITMPCFGTTSRTLENSITLAKTLGVTLKKIDISKSVTRHLKDINHNGEPNTAFENAQARERTQILMDIANMEGGLVVGTGDLSEVALGWSTYNGDHMSMFAVNSTIPKTLIREIVKQYAIKSRGKLKAVLLDVLGTPVSPELLPPDKDTIAQKTEDIVGPYELHDFFLYHFISRGASPKKIKHLAYHAFKGLYSEETIDKWLKKFFSRFITQQFKRSCSPEGVKTGSVSLSPRGDFNMPADTLTNLWLNDL